MIEEHLIRERAHSIWESEGRPPGRAEAHWARASQELAKTGKRAAKSVPRKAAAAAATSAPRVKAGPTAARKPGKAATA